MHARGIYGFNQIKGRGQSFAHMIVSLVACSPAQNGANSLKIECSLRDFNQANFNLALHDTCVLTF